MGPKSQGKEKGEGTQGNEKVTGKVTVDDEVIPEHGYFCHALCAGVLSDAGKGSGGGTDTGDLRSKVGSTEGTVSEWQILESRGER